jgi:hypothetical protein
MRFHVAPKANEICANNPCIFLPFWQNIFSSSLRKITTNTQNTMSELTPEAIAAERARLEAKYGGEVLDTKQLQEKYEVIAFLAPFCEVREKKTGVKGSLEFQHMPRFYYNFVPDDIQDN